MSKRLVRIDDFPHGDKALFSSQLDYKDRVKSFLDIFNSYNVPYILGVTPGLLFEGDLKFLEENIKTGWVVLHGQTHGWERPWDSITDCWAQGGEFEGQSYDLILKNYNQGFSLLSQLSRFDPEHYIAPFNCYNQTLLDVLSNTSTKFIHTCDKEYTTYHLNNLNHHNITPIISEFHKTYDHVHSVILNLDNPSQICLHWIYDSKRKEWLENYSKLSKLLT